MLDDYREVFAAALFRLGFDINTTDDAQLDQALALLQEQKPLLRTYSTDDIGAAVVRRRLDHARLGRGRVPGPGGAGHRSRTTCPSEGGVRGSDTMVLLAGAQHPVAAHLFMNYMLDAEVAADNTNYIGYMGPNEAAKQFIDPAILEDPTVNPDKATIDSAARDPRPRRRRGEVPGSLGDAPRGRLIPRDGPVGRSRARAAA